MATEMQWEARGVVCAFSAAVSVSDILAALTVIHNHEDYDRLRYTIYDFSCAEAVSVRDGDIANLLAHTIGASFSNPGLRTALIAVQPGHAALGALLKRESRRPVEVFAHMADAREWLEAPLQ